MNIKVENRTDNPDPITGQPGAHPVGTGVGALAGGAAAGAVVGTVAGPVGTAIGAVAGAIAGGLAGKGVAEMLDPTIEDAYWSENFRDRSYVSPDESYDDYGPAYRYGVDAYGKYPGRPFDEIEPDLQNDWDASRQSSKLTWERAKLASRDAWDRASNTVERVIPGDSDRDGR